MAPLFNRYATLLARVWEPRLSIVLALGLGLRLVLLPWFSDPYNFYGSYLATDLLSRGFDPLAIFEADPRFGELNPWGYPGLYFVFTLLANAAGGGDSFLYGVWLRIPLAFFDVGTTILIFRIALLLKGSERMATVSAIAFLFNPFSILITSVWGVNDPLPLFFTVLAIYFVVRNRERDMSWAGWAIGLGTALKLYPLLLLPVALARAVGGRNRLRLIVFSLGIPIVTSLPFLLTNATTYLGNLFGFASGAEDSLLDPQFTLLQGISMLTGPLPGTVSILSAVLLLIGSFFAFQMVRRNNLNAVSAAAFMILLTYILAVRWIANYALWAVPFTTLHAVLYSKGWRRWVVGMFWVPALAYSLLYIGWYPDPYSGASGLFYWALVSGSPHIRAHEYLPQFTDVFIVGLLISTTLISAFAILRPRAKGLENSGENLSTLRSSRPLPGGDRRGVLAALMLVVLVVGSVASTFVQISGRSEVAPLDFASYMPSSHQTIRIHDEFRSDLLSFRWMFRGTGVYTLRPDGIAGIRIDTVDLSEQAFIEDEVSAKVLWLNLTFRILRVDGDGPLVIARGPGGWVGASANLDGTLNLLYHDEMTRRSHSLGEIAYQTSPISLFYSVDLRRIGAGDTELELPSTDLTGPLQVGHSVDLVNAGGAAIFTEVTIEWSSHKVLPTGAPVWTVVVSGMLGLASAPLIAVSTRLRGSFSRQKPL